MTQISPGISQLNSIKNPKVALLRSLHQSKARNLHQQFLAEGLRTCQTLIKSNIGLIELFCTEKTFAQAKKLVAAQNVTIVSQEVMERISTATTPSGCLGLFTIPKNPNLSQLTSGIVLSHLADPGNIGTLIRTAVALNLKSVVMIAGADIYNPKIIQASAGTLGLINIFKTSWPELQSYAAQKGLTLSALVVKGGKNPATITDSDRLLVIGNEANGVPADMLATCDDSITIPMPGSAESLNAAIAGSIASYLIFNR